MDMSYAAVESRIQEAIDAFNTRQNAKISSLAQEFHVPYQRLRNRLGGAPSKSDIRGLHNRRLKPDQELALTLFYQRLSNAGTPARLNSIKNEANRLLLQDCDPVNPPPPIGPQWAKRWLDRQPNLFKTKRKPLAAERRNAHDLDLIATHFQRFRDVVQEHDIHRADIWNFDETGYRIGMARSDWVVAVDPTRTIYSKCPNNRELLTAIECINGVGSEIPPFLIVTGTNILAPWFLNDLDPNVAVTTAETGFNNDWISLQWIKHFERYSRRQQQGCRRLLIMDGYGSHDTYEFLEYCEHYNIIPLTFPSHTTHLLQPLDVVVFQPLKHYHSEAVNMAISTGDESFTKVEFLAAFTKFRRQAFKSSTIRSAFRETGLIPYNPEVVLEKVRNTLPPPRPITPEAEPFKPLIETPRTIRQLAESGLELMTHPRIPEDLQVSIHKFMRGGVAVARCGLLMEQRLDTTIAAENARKARKQEANKVLQKGGILYSSNARRMNQERLEIELQREKDRQAAWQKKYENALKKVYKGTKQHVKTWQSPRKWEIRIWKEVVKEFMNSVAIYVE